MMELSKLTDAQKVVLVGQVATLIGTMLISLGTLLSMNEPPQQPIFGTSSNGTGSLGSTGRSNSAESYFF